MNDELELIEEFQSDSIDELVSERKKIKVHWLNKNIVAIHCFMQQYLWFYVMKGALLMIPLIKVVKQIWV